MKSGNLIVFKVPNPADYPKDKIFKGCLPFGEWLLSCF